MSPHLHWETVERLRNLLAPLHTPASLFEACAQILHDEAAADRVFFHLPASDAKIIGFAGTAACAALESVTASARVQERSLLLHETAIPLPFFVRDVHRARLRAETLKILQARGVVSLALLPLFNGATLIGWIECQYRSNYQHWHLEECEVFRHLSDVAAFALERLSVRTEPTPNPPAASSTQGTDASGYRRLVDYGNLLLIRTNQQFRITEVIGDTERILGISPQELLCSDGGWWRFLHSSDLRRLRLKIRDLSRAPGEITDEIRVRNSASGEMRWLMLKGIPLYSRERTLIGWEGVGIDITEKRKTEADLIAERQRIKALYEVSRALQAVTDPALVMLHGLRALIAATRSECGFCCLFDQSSQKNEVVAANGLSEECVQEVTQLVNQASLVQQAIETGLPALVDDLQNDTRAKFGLARREGLRATIIAPCTVEGRVLGAIVLSRRKQTRYSKADFDLVTAAASQIALAASQAELYVAEKKQADSLSALYRLSHQLSKQLTPLEVAEHAFPIIQSEIACKRLWFGVTNEQGTHIIGQAGYGPGVRKHIIDIQIELDLQHDFLDEAIRTRQAVIVEPHQKIECSGLNRIMTLLKPGLFVIVPLVALGQVVGLLVVEPAVPSVFFSQRHLPLLTSMASEIATVVLARRFENKMAEADKMRMAGLLASGVAHNFNNLLQAVMGQASLIEMQLSKDSPLTGSTRMILAAASKGAALIKQLLSFSVRGSSAVQIFSFNQLLQESRDLYRSILGTEIEMSIKLDLDAPEVSGDYSQLQQVLTNLLVNAKEALHGKKQGEVRLQTRRVRLRSGEVDPELAPGVYLRIDVEDNGPGMSAEQQTRCFEPFFTTKNTDASTGLGFGGFGLGLSAAYSILKHHEGLITVSSTLGEGAQFSIYLPEAIHAKKEEVKEKVADFFDPELVRVTLVNLEPPSAFSVVASLQSLGIRTAVVNTKEEAVQAAADHDQALAFFLIDGERTRSELTTVIHLVREVQPNARFGIISSDAAQTEVLRDEEGIEIFERPLDVWRVPTALRRFFKGHESKPTLAHSLHIARTGEKDEILAPVTPSSKKSVKEHGRNKDSL